MQRAALATAQFLLGAVLLFTGTAHMTFSRTEFRAQVPSWLPLDADVVVLASGLTVSSWPWPCWPPGASPTELSSA
ncbi:hypothetical protein [Paractinoplanes lichenicola]|uniref:Uncharacterized protein n=1 Tax=Paractinoplanes lichenicola TaxID=2802976 RepID=A0ABS1VMF1_9ACTN|nr:hypothetical protein [Actinoplanes lichenicola]MBL7255895.1 hypothetical protein [Actinoplanes lichenicola]